MQSANSKYGSLEENQDKNPIASTSTADLMLKMGKMKIILKAKLKKRVKMMKYIRKMSQKSKNLRWTNFPNGACQRLWRSTRRKITKIIMMRIKIFKASGRESIKDREVAVY